MQHPEKQPELCSPSITEHLAWRASCFSRLEPLTREEQHQDLQTCRVHLDFPLYLKDEFKEIDTDFMHDINLYMPLDTESC